MPNVDNLKANQDNGRDPIQGIYRARVENNLDPLHLGRVKCRIPQLHGIPGGDSALANADLPWAYPITLTGTGYNHGSCVVPEAGDYVFVMFENGDRNSPVYLGGCYGIPTGSKDYGNDGKGWSAPTGANELPQEVYGSGSAPNGKVIYKSPKGFLIMTHETDNEESLIIADNDGQQIMIYNPSSDNISEVSIDGKDGQGIHVRSTAGGDAEVTILSPNQTTMLKVIEGTALLKAGENKVECSNSGITIVGNVTIKGNIKHEGKLSNTSGITTNSSISATGTVHGSNI